MNENFLQYEEALALKKLGFDEPCLHYVDKENEGYIYNFQCHPKEFIEWCACDVIKSPLYQQAFRWFDENSEYQGFITGSIKENAFDWEIRTDGKVVAECDQYYIIRQEAELACIEKLIEIVKTK